MTSLELIKQLKELGALYIKVDRDGSSEEPTCIECTFQPSLSGFEDPSLSEDERQKILHQERDRIRFNGAV